MSRSIPSCRAASASDWTQMAASITSVSPLCELPTPSTISSEREASTVTAPGRFFVIQPVGDNEQAGLVV